MGVSYPPLPTWSVYLLTGWKTSCVRLQEKEIPPWALYCPPSFKHGHAPGAPSASPSGSEMQRLGRGDKEEQWWGPHGPGGAAARLKVPA